MPLWIELLLAAIGVTAVNCLLLFYPRIKQKEIFHHVTVKFAGGNKTKLVLNGEQYEQLKAFLNQADGHFEIGDELDNVKLYREHICSVEVKKK